MADDDFNLSSVASWVKQVGGAIKFGPGLLGRSSVPLCVFQLAGAIALWKLQSDLMRVTVLLIMAIVFFIWFFPVKNFASAHAEIALLEGGEYLSFKQFEGSAKNYTPQPQDKVPTTTLPESSAPELPAGIDESEVD